MLDRQAIFLTPGPVELTSERCDFKCAWCTFCRGRDLSATTLAQKWKSPPPERMQVLRLRGGDPFRYAALDEWVRWGRRVPECAICVEGPAASLAAHDRATIIANLTRIGVDAVSAILPTVEKNRTMALTGRQWDPRDALATLAHLATAGIAIEVIFPILTATLDELPRVIAAVTNALPNTVLTLRRAGSVRGPNGAIVPSTWSELDRLSEVIAALPMPNNLGVRLHFDAEDAYGACMVAPAARRGDLFPAQNLGGRRPLGQPCEPCAWWAHCTFQPDRGVPPVHRVQPLNADEANLLEARTPGRHQMGAEPRPFHTDRASVGLPNLLCFAPWTTLTVTDPRRSPVPCALSWVETDMTAEAIANELGTDVDIEREHLKIAREEHKLPDAQWSVVDNERLSLMDLWNSPLMRLMRREMHGGEKSSRCRTMCRVVMGVEERGIAYFQRADNDLPKEIIANRNLLREEIHEGKTVLTAKPMDFVIGVAAHCNISCGFCDGPLGAYGDLSDKRRDEIIEWLPTLMGFGVSGSGEPLMNKNYLQLLRYISDVGFPALSVGLTTNGTLLTPEFLARNCNVPWGSVRISLNAGSAETYARMTEGKRYFDRVMKNLGALCDLRERSSPRFSVTLSLVLGSVQMGDLAKFAQIVHDYGTGIVVEPMYDDLRELSPWTRRERLLLLADELTAVANAYVEKNPDIARAFRAVEQFARHRLTKGHLGVLKGH